MNALRTISHLREYIKELKSRNATIGLVPTMGALHEGHLSLIKKATAVNTDMQDVSTIQNGDILALAAYFGTTRLIDNHIFGDTIPF